MEIFNKVCPGCGQEFRTEIGVRVYCSTTCLQRQYKRRRAQKEREIKATRKGDNVENALWSPTVEKLNTLAQTLLVVEDIACFTFRGTIPAWTPPPGILWQDCGTHYAMAKGTDLKSLLEQGNVEIVKTTT